MFCRRTPTFRAPSPKVREGRTRVTGGPSGNPGQVDGTLTTLSVSALDAEVIWAGSNDSHVNVTTDGGDTWTELSTTTFRNHNLENIVPTTVTTPAAKEPSQPLPSSVISSPRPTFRLRAMTVPMTISAASGSSR